MKLSATLLAVKSVEVSKKFYSELFDCQVTLDFGKNVSFDSGFAIQEDFAWLTGISSNFIIEKSNNMELYFETDDFDAFIEKLNNFNSVVYVHKTKEHEWKQRVVRIYDPDFHIIEIGESMAVIARKYVALGYSIEKTSEIIQHPTEFVQMCVDQNM